MTVTEKRESSKGKNRGVPSGNTSISSVEHVYGHLCYAKIHGCKSMLMSEKADSSTSMLRRKVAAFTLLEFLLTVLMISGGIAWLLYADFLSLRSTRTIFTKFQVTKGILEYQLEVLRGLSFDDSKLSVGPPVNILTSDPIISMLNPNLPPIDSLLSVVVAATYTVEAVTPEVKKIVISATWNDSFGRQHTDTLSTLISKSGLTNP